MSTQSNGHSGNGNANKHVVSGGLGLVSGRLTLEGPIIRNRSSYLVGGRFSYANWLVQATDQISLRNSAANFRDFTAKIFHTVDEGNYLTLSGYHSFDDFKLATDSVFSWQTTNFSLKWDHTFDERSFSALTLSSSNYSSNVRSSPENACRSGSCGDCSTMNGSTFETSSSYGSY